MRIKELGLLLAEGIRERAAHHGLPLLVQGPGPMFHTGFTHLAAVTDFREYTSYRPAPPRPVSLRPSAARGARYRPRVVVYFGRSQQSHIDSALQAVDDVLSEIKRAESQAAGRTQ